MDKVGFGRNSGSLRTNINASEYEVVKVEQRGKEGFNIEIHYELQLVLSKDWASLINRQCNQAVKYSIVEVLSTADGLCVY